MWHVLWALCGAFGLIETSNRESLTKAVLYLTVMPIANLPIGLYVARRSLKACFPYGATMAMTGLCMVPVGSWLLFHADLGALKYGVGSFFTLFSVGKLTSSVAAWGAQRKARAELVPGAERSIVVSEFSKRADGLPTRLETPSFDASRGASPSSRTGSFSAAVGPEPPFPSPPSEAGAAGRLPVANPSVLESPRAGLLRPRKSSAGACIDTANLEVLSVSSPRDLRADHGAGTPPSADELRSAGEPTTTTGVPSVAGPSSVCKLESVSPVYSVRAALGALFGTGVLSGLLGGLFGTGGPPQMIAFAVLRVDKDVIRGVSMVYGLLECGMRVIMFTTSDGNVFSAAEWPIYAGIAVASWVGFVVGTWLRRYADTDMIIRMLLLLVFTSSAILLGALTTHAVAVGFAVAGAAWLGLLAFVFRHPHRWDSFSAAVRRALCACGWAKSSQRTQQWQDSPRGTTGEESLAGDVSASKFSANPVTYEGGTEVV